VRTKIKEVLLSNLISPNVLVMRAGANVIAQIAAIEIPRGEWLEIVSSLADNSIHEDLNIRRASVTTLGFICEELKNVQTIINKQTCEQILASLLICLRENGEIVEIALTALRESVIFLRHILENEGYCNQVFEYVFPLLATDYRGKVYEFLFEFGRYSYHMLGNYIALIAQASVQHID
jgi:importin subunit beta-1